MRTGWVDEDWAREHHDYWYDDIAAGKIPGAAQPGRWCRRRRETARPGLKHRRDSDDEQIPGVRVLIAAAAAWRSPSCRAPDDATKAKAAETAAKAAWQAKVDGYQLCKVQDKVAAQYMKTPAKTAAKDCKASAYARGAPRTGRRASRLPRAAIRHACSLRASCRPADPARIRLQPADRAEAAWRSSAARIRPTGDGRQLPAEWQAALGGDGSRHVAFRYGLAIPHRSPRAADARDRNRQRARRASTTSIPAERPLTVYVDRRELVTLMTLGARPEWLVLGYLRNQRLVRSVDEVESITVDWEVGAAAVKTRSGIKRLKERTARRVVTTGCGQGSVFGGLMDEIESIRLPEASHHPGPALRHPQRDPPAGKHVQVGRIGAWLRAVRGRARCCCSSRTSAATTPSTRLPAGCGCRLAVTGDKVFYTTGRLTSEMIIKSAQMGVPIVVSRSGMTQMGHEIAQRLDLCAIGRATNKHFLCYTAPHRLTRADPVRRAV